MDTGAQHTPDGHVPAAQYDELLLKYESLLKTYHEYRKEAEERAEKAAVKIRTAKEHIRRWQVYIDKKLAKQALREANQDFATPRAAQSVQNGLSDNEGPVALLNPAVEAARSASLSASQTPTHSKITSSQTTEGEAAARSSSIAHSDDYPVVVSARSLKRKRDSPSNDSQAVKIKNELLSSSPHSRTPIPSLLRTETSDLDVYRNQTRHRQPRITDGTHPLRRNTVRSFSGSVTGNTEEPAHNTIETPTASRRSDSGRHDELAIGHPETDPDASQEYSGKSDKTTKCIKTEAGLVPASRSKENALSRNTSKSVGPRESRPNGGPLRTLSPNTPTLPRTSAAPVTTGRKYDRSRGVDAVHILSEDGDNLRPSVKKPRIDQTTPKASGQGRLNQLLEGASPQISRTILSPRSAPGARRLREDVDQHASRSFEQPKSRTTRTVRDTFSTRDVHAEDQDESGSDDPGFVLPEHEPLRSRPLHRLNLDDFRVNPNTSGGLGYAYRESIRRREEKRCLPGCTREECCGSIRRFIAAGGLPADTSLTDDELTLQGYLGSSYAQVIHRASEEERQQMLVEARAKAFADRHGKHRQVFERRATPPGFWRTDMPTTQELEQDREEARELERQKVEERWRDAMRGGGRYMFRDES